jgi:hypothetical protein
MAEFLSREWMAEVEAAAPAFDPTVSICVQYQVVGGPGGDVDYTAELANGHLAVHPHGAAQPDIRIRVPYTVAADLAGCVVTLHDAVLAGTVKVRGNLDVLQTATPALAILSAAMATVQEHTTYRR